MLEASSRTGGVLAGLRVGAHDRGVCLVSFWHIDLRSTPGAHRVIRDGEDITHQVVSLRIEADPSSLPRLWVEFLPDELRVDMDDPEVATP